MPRVCSLCSCYIRAYDILMEPVAAPGLGMAYAAASLSQTCAAHLHSHLYTGQLALSAQAGKAEDGMCHLHMEGGFVGGGRLWGIQGDKCLRGVCRNPLQPVDPVGDADRRRLWVAWGPDEVPTGPCLPVAGHQAGVCVQVDLVGAVRYGSQYLLYALHRGVL